jgi:ferredoxin-fold anticodon binding domain-containing protein
MLSRAIQKIPEDNKELRKFLRKVLQDHYKDIKILFEQTTDNDLFEKHQRDLS